MGSSVVFGNDCGVVHGCSPDAWHGSPDSWSLVGSVPVIGGSVFHCCTSASGEPESGTGFPLLLPVVGHLRMPLRLWNLGRAASYFVSTLIILNWQHQSPKTLRHNPLTLHERGHVSFVSRTPGSFHSAETRYDDSRNTGPGCPLTRPHTSGENLLIITQGRSATKHRFSQVRCHVGTMGIWGFGLVLRPLRFWVTAPRVAECKIQLSHRAVAEYKIRLSPCVMSAQPPPGG